MEDDGFQSFRQFASADAQHTQEANITTANDFFVSFSLAPRIVGESRSALLNPHLGLVFCKFLMKRIARFHIILRRPGE